MQLIHSPIHQYQLFDHQIWLKRDDLLGAAEPDLAMPSVFAGNKARKFARLFALPATEYQVLVGYGSAQANSLATMAALAKQKGWQLLFYVDHLSDYLRQNPQGNYRFALEQGAQIIDYSAQATQISLPQYLEQQLVPQLRAQGTRVLFIPEGGRCALAQSGVHQLAKELATWVMTQGGLSSQSNAFKKITANVTAKVFLPSGTGTTAVYLQQYFKMQQLPIEVLTIACVGGDAYLKQQFTELEPNEAHHPRIINLGKKYHFGKLYPEFWQVWQEVQQPQLAKEQVEFELLYDPLGLLMLKDYLASSAANEHCSEDKKEVIIYLHQGGLLGNETMLPRYQRKYQTHK